MWWLHGTTDGAVSRQTPAQRPAHPHLLGFVYPGPAKGDGRRHAGALA